MTFAFIVVLHIVATRSILILWSSPNIILIAVILAALMRGSVFGQLFGFLFGLMADTLSVGLFGANTFAFTLTGYLSGTMSKKLDISQYKAQMIFTFLLSILYVTVIIVIHSIFLDENSIFSVKVVWFSPFLNAVFAPFIYWLFAKWTKLWFPGERTHSALRKKYDF